MRFIRFLAGCIDDKQQIISERICHHHVVENAALCVRKEGVAQATRLQAHDIDSERAARERDAASTTLPDFARTDDLPHMRDVEQTGGRACMQVLFEYAERILNRHLVPGEGHHPRTKFDVQRVQWSCFQVRLVQSGIPTRWRPFQLGPATATAADVATFAEPR